VPRQQLRIFFAAILIAGCAAYAVNIARAKKSTQGFKPNAAATEQVINVSSGGQRRVEEIHRGYETVCRVDGRDFPPSYRVSDMGKPGVPLLRGDELHQVRMISRYVHSPNLRFQEVAGQFLVYDASLGPCLLAAPGYWVLNAHACNLYFMPADEWDGPSAVPGCYSPQRPWMPRDGGDPKLKWGHFPSAGISTSPPSQQNK
jgi:hypothetical protein